MIYSLENIKSDINSLTEKQFYTKHVIRSDNWYFEEYLGKDSKEVMHLIDDYRLIVSECFGVSFNSVMMVGSGKLGYSMSPPNIDYPEKSKTFLPFNDDEKIRKISDLDIAIISSDIFHEYWKKFRNSYKTKFQNTYLHLYNELYRGYINERNILEVDGCRIKLHVYLKKNYDTIYILNMIYRIEYIEIGKILKNIIFKILEK